MSRTDVNIEFGKCSFDKEESYISLSQIQEKKTEPAVGNLRSGNLYFDEHRLDSKHIPFISAPYTVDMHDLMKMLFEEWHLFLPRIILYAIAETDDTMSDAYRKLSRKLVRGLVHVLNTTEMWLCTDGLDYGLSRDMSKAFENETSRRKTVESSMKNTNTGFPETALIGICRRDILTFSEKFEEEEKSVSSENESKIRMNINKHFGHFIFVDDTTESRQGVYHFMLNFARFINTGDCKQFISDDPSAYTLKSKNTPIIALLLQGKITQLDLVLGHLRQGLPLIVFEGSGGLADLLAFIHNQAHFRPQSINIAEFTEAVLKPQVLDKMHELYPKFTDYKISLLTEKLFDCVRYSNIRDRDYMTVIDLNNVDFKPYLFPSILLKSIFKAEISDEVKDFGKMKSDLLLTIDWNSPNIAKEEVFAKDIRNQFVIDNEMFFRALTKPNREEFVSLFLEHGFLVHEYLDSSNLLDLFQNSLSREFFKSIVWESVFGFGSNVEISRSFLDSKLIILIEELTGIPSLINSYELDWNCRKIYDDRTPEEAERKAMTVLALWAILSYRVQLVKVIWKNSEQPIHIALACSIILRKLEAYVTDLSLQNEMNKHSKEFSIMASDVMSLCYESVPCRALDLLNEKNRVWSFKGLMELAAFAKNKMFLAQPCCQKYLDNLFMGYIKVRDLPYGDITIPLWLKIILCAFLLFPITLWVRFEIPHAKKQLKENYSDKKSLRKQDSYEQEIRADIKDEDEMLSSKQKQEMEKPGIFYEIYYLWSAPITKFWTTQISYVGFLFLFSLAVLWPACGNVILDFFTCVWIGIFIIDSIYHAYTLNTKYASMPLVYKSLEISVLILFLFGYVMGRIFWKNSFMTPYNAKVMLCFALLYFYYRLIFVALPISSELGPMLYRVRRMVTVDFSSYIRVTILVIISNGIAIHATVYPDYPLNVELLRRALYDALISFFLTPADNYGNPNPKCILLKRSENKKSFIGFPENECKVGRYYKYDCQNPGVWPYIFGLQYLIILRLILVSMLYALFSNTARKLEEEGKYIWKYQCYELVIIFSNRTTLPPPFSLFEFIYMLFRHLFKKLLRLLRISKRKRQSISSKLEQEDKLDEGDFKYWKNLAMYYHSKKKKEEEEKMTTKKRMDRINALSNALNSQRRSIRALKGHLSELQIEITNAHEYLLSSALKVSLRERLQAQHIPQIFSRISPYPNTMITRFPVSDSHVPWTSNWSMYDPIAFTLPKEDFPSYLRPHIDVDIQKKRETERDSFTMPNFNWNLISLSPGGVSVDRQSWITDKSKKTFKYELDSEGLPKNPYGRTGLRGRGFLPRWGPNHYIYLLITRWNDKDIAFQKYLNIMLMDVDGDTSLPGGYVHTENRYDIIKSLFQTDQLWLTSDNMVAYFESLVKDTSKVAKSSTWRRASKKDVSKEEEEIEKFKAERIKLGYMDVETNTDQAWCEAEIWHFHYEVEENIEENVKGNIAWYSLDDEILTRVPIGQAAIMYSVAKKMKAIMEVV